MKPSRCLGSPGDFHIRTYCEHTAFFSAPFIHGRGRIGSRSLRSSPSAEGPSYLPFHPKYDLQSNSRCGRGRKRYLRAHPGEIIGYLAFGHPFLDGNGRTMVTLFSAMAQRAGFSIDWSATDKDAYLAALTKEIDTPSKGHLDQYLEQFIGEPISHEGLSTQVINAPGLGGRTPQTTRTRSSETSTRLK